MNNTKYQNLVIFSFKIRMKQIFTIKKPNVMKKSKFEEKFNCFVGCILFVMHFSLVTSRIW